MGEVERARPKAPPPADLAYGILKLHGQPMHFRDLMARVLEACGGPAPGEPGAARLVAAIHTEINLDTRFQHLGAGLWGLAAWTPSRRRARVSPVGAGRPEAQRPARRPARSIRDELLAEARADQELAAFLEDDEVEELEPVEADDLDDELGPDGEGPEPDARPWPEASPAEPSWEED